MNVELTDIEQYAKSRGLTAQFVSLPEAKEYRQTLQVRHTVIPQVSKPAEIELPAKLFEAAAG
jgi:hypothetical protein